LDFPTLTLLDTEASIAWIEQHFHPNGFGCPHCQADLAEARLFRLGAVLQWRHRLHDRAGAIQPDTPLPDTVTESDEIFQNAGEKTTSSSTQPTRRAVGQIKSLDAVRLPMTGRRSWTQLGA
jgi:hypothetical protein